MRKALLIACLILPILILLPHLSQFPFQPGGQFSDLLISHYPNGIYIQQSIKNWKTIPLWSDTILSGYPFVANPLAGLFYLPGWLALLFQLPLGFNLLVALHLVFGGVGMYLLLREEGLSTGPALLGAVLFEGMPKLFSHLGAGHITLIYAVTWTPWLLYTEKRASLSIRLRWVLPGAVLGMIALADIRWAAYSGLVWLAYSLRVSFGQGWANGSGWRLVPWVASRLTNVLVSGLVAAPLLLPLAQYTQLSTRSQLTIQESFILSLPFSQLLSLLFPNIGGMAEWILYPGGVGISLFLLTLCNPKMLRRAGFWVGLVALSLIFALGSNLPPLELLGHLPGMDLLRVPPRTLFLTGLGFAAVAGYGLQSLCEVTRLVEEKPLLRGKLVLFCVTAFVVFLAGAIQFVVERPLTRVQFAWGAIFLLLSTVVILLAINQRIPTTGLAASLLVISLVDFQGVNLQSLEFRPSSVVLSAKAELVKFLNEREGATLYRVYSPSYSLPQEIAVQSGIQLADGVDPLQLAAYVDYMEAATGVPNRGYSVTLPPYANAETETDNQGYHPDPVRLGLLNVKYILSEFPLSDADLLLLKQFGQTMVYENTQALPRAWVQMPTAPLGQAIEPIAAINMTPNWIEVTAEGPGELVLSEIAYPGWQATVDGVRMPVDTMGGLLRGVKIQPGLHRVVFSFHPQAVYIGLGLAGITWVVLAIFILFRSHTRPCPIE